jgi:hypothetical protein
MKSALKNLTHIVQYAGNCVMPLLNARQDGVNLRSARAVRACNNKHPSLYHDVLICHKRTPNDLEEIDK